MPQTQSVARHTLVSIGRHQVTFRKKKSQECRAKKRRALFQTRPLFRECLENAYRVTAATSAVVAPFAGTALESSGNSELERLVSAPVVLVPLPNTK